MYNFQKFWENFLNRLDTFSLGFQMEEPIETKSDSWNAFGTSVDHFNCCEWDPIFVNVEFLTN